MKRRFKYILSKNGKKNGIVLVACAVILSIGIGALVGCSTAQRAVNGNSLSLNDNPEQTEQTEPTEQADVVPDYARAEEIGRSARVESLGSGGTATLFFGDGYSMYIYDQGCNYRKEMMDGCPADVWSLASDENAQIRVVRLENIKRLEAQDWVRAQFPKRIFLHNPGYDDPKRTGDMWAEDMQYYGYLYVYFFPKGGDMYVVIEDCKQIGIDAEAMRLNSTSHSTLRSMLSTFQLFGRAAEWPTRFH